MPHGILRAAFGYVDHLKPLTTKKNPSVAAACGFALGGLGLGLYLQSWKDVLIPFVILLVLVIASAFTGGLSTLFIPFAWAYYAHRRVTTSNAKLAGFDSNIVEAEIITTAPVKNRIMPPGQAGAEGRLRQLDDLLRTGVLTQAERDEKRRAILNTL